MEKNMISQGEVKISNEVIAAIAGKAAKNINGVAGLTDRFVDSMAKILTGYEKGVEVNINEDHAEITLSLVVKFNFFIPDVSSKVQTEVKKAVESMTGLQIDTVNVNIQGIDIEKLEKSEKPVKDTKNTDKK